MANVKQAMDALQTTSQSETSGRLVTRTEPTQRKVLCKLHPHVLLSYQALAAS